MKLVCRSPKVRPLLAALLLLATAGSAGALAAEHCGDVGVTVVPAPVAGGTEKNNCGTAWTTCGTMQLTINDARVSQVKRYVSEQQKDGRYGPMVETDDCARTFGTCAWDGPPKIVQRGDQTIITQTLKSWVNRDDVGTWTQATRVLYG